MPIPLTQKQPQTQRRCRSARNRSDTNSTSQHTSFAMAATAAGTASFFVRKAATHAASSTPVCVTSKRTGLTLSRVAYGLDNTGATTTARAEALMTALGSGVCNTVVVNLNELADRQRASSPMFVRDRVSQLWEAHVLQEILHTGRVRRDEAVVVGSIMLADAGARPWALPSRVPVAEVASLVSSAATWLGIPSLDVVLVHLPSSPTHFPVVSELPPLVRALEGVVASGGAGSYGLSCNRLSLYGDNDGRYSATQLMDVAHGVVSSPKLSCVAYEFGMGDTTALAAADSRSVAALMKERDVIRIARRPFDVTQGGRRYRLASSPRTSTENDYTDGEAVAKRLSESLRHCVELEQEYDRLVAPRVEHKTPVPPGSSTSPNMPVIQDGHWARMLVFALKDFSSLLEWEGLRQLNISRAIEDVTRYAHSFDDTRSWALAYKASMVRLLDDVAAVMRFRNDQQMEVLASAMKDSGLEVTQPLELGLARLLLAADGVDVVATELNSVFTDDVFKGHLSTADAQRALTTFTVPVLDPV